MKWSIANLNCGGGDVTRPFRGIEARRLNSRAACQALDQRSKIKSVEQKIDLCR